MENNNDQNGNFNGGQPENTQGNNPGNADNSTPVNGFNPNESGNAQNNPYNANGADNGGANPYGNYGPGAYNGNSGYGNYSAPGQNTQDNAQGGYGQGNNQGYNGYSQYGQTPNPEQNPYSQYGGNVQYKWNYDDYQKALGQKSSEQKEKPQGKKRGLKPFLVTVSCVVVVAVVGLAVYGGVCAFGGVAPNAGDSLKGSTSTALQQQNQPTTSSAAATTGSVLSIEQVNTKVTPSVVGIEIYSVTSSSVEPTAEGTGIIMSSDGYILTNNHVVSGAQKIQVVLSNGKKYDKVKLVGTDSKTDLAVLKISATGLTAATFGNSAQLKVGQAVVAIGNPDGLTLASTVTNGIVSGLNRAVSTSSGSSSVKYIQTNAAINPGNSGGPLVNLYGQVVGINTAKISETGYEGLGFSIPINTAKPIVDSIIKYGYVKGRVKLGITVYNLSSTQAQWYNYPAGLYVETIDSTCDAYTKGLRAKDIITKINGISIASDDSDTIFNTFYKEESKYKPGETVSLTVYSPDTGNTSTISVKLEEDKGTSNSVSTDTSSSDDSSDDSGNSYYGNSNGTSSGSSNDNSFWSNFNQ
jgi:serine protease Do